MSIIGNGLHGTWAVGSIGEHVFEAKAIFGTNFIEAAKAADSYNTVFFWPYGFTIEQAIDWWEKGGDDVTGSGEEDRGDRSSVRDQSNGEAEKAPGADPRTAEVSGQDRGSSLETPETVGLEERVAKFREDKKLAYLDSVRIAWWAPVILHLQVCDSTTLNLLAERFQCAHEYWYHYSSGQVSRGYI